MNEIVFDQVFHSYGEASVEIIKLYRLVGSIYNFYSILTLSIASRAVLRAERLCPRPGITAMEYRQKM